MHYSYLFHSLIYTLIVDLGVVCQLFYSVSSLRLVACAWTPASFFSGSETHDGWPCQQWIPTLCSHLASAHLRASLTWGDVLLVLSVLRLSHRAALRPVHASQLLR